MKPKHYTSAFLLFVLLLVTGCAGRLQTHNPQKLGKNDPFAQTMVLSEYFEIDADKGNVLEGGKGTVVSFPKGCFVDKKGKPVGGRVKIELAEALTFDDMILSNLTTTSGGKLLETDGMVYVNATTPAGENLFINPDKPAYIEIPSKNKRAGMKAYTGIRDDNGNMDWVNPKEIENYLVAVDLKELDFLPEGFAAEVKKGIPFKHYKKATQELTDSLYYSLAPLRGQLFTFEGASPAVPAQGYNEPYYNSNKQIDTTKGEYTKESYEVHGHHEARAESDSLDNEPNSGIDPAVIKTIRQERFSKSYIATREFEARLRVIYKTCDNDLLLLYVNNLDKNLWQVDEMAARKLGQNSKWSKRFMKFAAHRHTNVKEADENAELLKAYFDEQSAMIKVRLDSLYNVARSQIAERQRMADSVAVEYAKLLLKRETYRMERYGFNWTNTGWVNIDTGTVPKDISYKKLELTVARGKDFDRVESYIVFVGMKSIYHLETNDKEIHFVGQDPDRNMIMPDAASAKIVAIGYKDTAVYMGVINFVTGSSEKARISLNPSNKLAVQMVLNDIEAGNFTGNMHTDIKDYEVRLFEVKKGGGYAEENRISLDLEYQSFFYQEQQYQNQLAKESAFLHKLYKIAFPCNACDNKEAVGIGGHYFNQHCKACHSISVDGIGPALAGITQRRTMPWLIKFTRNWKDLVEGEKDKLAIDVTNARPSEMNVFPTLTDENIRDIYKYIDCDGGVYSQPSQ